MPTHREMEKICLELAKDADPLVADALRSLSSNYKNVEDHPRRRRFGLAILIVAFAAVSLVLHFTSTQLFPREGPPGRKTERVFDWSHSTPTDTVARTYAFNTAKEAGIPLIVYEGLSPLPNDKFDVSPYGKETWRFVLIRSSDGTDPRTNGRKYWIVAR